MKNTQLELGKGTQRSRIRRRPHHDSRWWFLQMHRAVEEDQETDEIRRIKDDDFQCPNENR